MEPRHALTGPYGVAITGRSTPMPARRRAWLMVECPEWQRGRTVNPLANAFVGSSPTSTTKSATSDQLAVTKALLPSTLTRRLAGARGRLRSMVGRWYLVNGHRPRV